VRRRREQLALRPVTSSDLRRFDDLHRAAAVGGADPEWSAAGLTGIAHHAADAQRPIEFRQHRLGTRIGGQHDTELVARETARRLDRRRRRRAGADPRQVRE